MRLTIPLLAVALVASACSNASTEPAEDDTTTTTQTTSTEANFDGPGDDPATILGDAIEHLIAAGSYAFEAEVQLSVNGEQVETELDGWVDGDDRELELSIGDQTVITRVIAGTATIERDGAVTTVEASEAADAPSIEVLRDIRDLELQPNGKLAGSLNAADLGDGGFDVNGAGTIQLAISPTGALAGYEIVGNNGSWGIEVRFAQLGATFSP